MTPPEPLLLRRRDFRELSVAANDDDTLALTIGRPDCHGGPDELVLTIEDAVALIDRLVHEVAEIRGGTKGGAGSVGSTY